MDLCVGALEGHVGYPLRPGELAGQLDSGRRDVNAERTACLGHAGGLTGGLPEPASDVQNMLAGLDAIGPAQHLIVPPHLVVVIARPGPVHHGSHLERPARNPAQLPSVQVVGGLPGWWPL